MSDVSVLLNEDYLDKDYFLDAQIDLKDAGEEKNEKKLKVIKVVF